MPVQTRYRYILRVTGYINTKNQLKVKEVFYGSKRERFITPDPLQSTLFDLPATEVTVAKTEDIAFTRTKPQAREKKHPLRAELPAHLPRKTEIIEPENLHIPDSTIGGWADTAIERWKVHRGWAL
jgi:hypothetical protein